MASITHIFGGAFNPDDEGNNIDTPEAQIKAEMERYGLTPPSSIYFDGVIHRFNSSSGKKDKSGWYLLHGDGIPAGAFGCFKNGVEQNWRADIGRELSPEEHAANNKRMEEAREARKEEQKLTRQTAAETAKELWIEAPVASVDHPYLKRKGIKQHGARIMRDGRLAVPLYSDTGEISSLQYISGDGVKRYHTGGATSGKMWMVGNHEAEGPIYIAEGFATAATISEQTGNACVIAYSANNLVSVTGSAREIYKTRELIIVADNDMSGTGQNYAEQAGAKHGVQVIVMPSLGDANDYHQAGNDLKQLLTPIKKSKGFHLTRASSLISQPSPLQWLIYKWVPASSNGMIFGPSGIGKSFIAIDMACSIVTGKPWDDMKVNKKGVVVYLAGEGNYGMRQRMASWCKHNNVTPEALDDLLVSNMPIDLDSKGIELDVLRHIKEITDEPVSAIFIDTLNRHMSGDENSAQDVRILNNVCSMLTSATGAATIIVHHTGKDINAQGKERGSSSIRASLDVSILVSKGKTDDISISVVKMKDAKEPDSKGASLTQIDLGWIDEDGNNDFGAIVTYSKFEQEEQIKVSVSEKFLNDRQDFEDAWFDSGREFKDGKPYITRSALKQFLRGKGLAESTIITKTKKGRKDGLVYSLFEQNVIEERGAGWVISDEKTASIMQLLKDC